VNRRDDVFMIYVTGDLHGHIDIHKFNVSSFPEQKNLTKDDYVIICGDFGLVWDGLKQEMYWRRWLDKKPFTTLFVAGNHENYHRLNEFPIQEKFGGEVRQISDSIYQLCNGFVFNIDGNKIFVMGGATSHDKWARIEGASWWPEEIPSYENMTAGLYWLNDCGYKVDYILSHCAPTSIQKSISPYYKEDILTTYLDTIKDTTEYKRWYCGHYHIDEDIDDKHTVLYRKIIPIGNKAG
jgi:hypothetical protein